VSKPYISIIIPSHNRNRKRYLLEAVKSALNQDLFHDLYEIIVVKYYNEKDLDKQLEEWGVKNIFLKRSRWVAKFLKAYKLPRVKLLVFWKTTTCFVRISYKRFIMYSKITI
jgi:Glycosyl transferase family 2.